MLGNSITVASDACNRFVDGVGKHILDGELKKRTKPFAMRYSSKEV